MDSQQHQQHPSQLRKNKMWLQLYQQQHNHHHHHQIMQNPSSSSSLPSPTNRFPPHPHSNIPLQINHNTSSSSSSSSSPSPKNPFPSHSHTNIIPLQTIHCPSSPSPTNRSPFHPYNNIPSGVQSFTTPNSNTIVQTSGFEDFRCKSSGFLIKGPDVFDSGLGPASVSSGIGSHGGVKVDSGETTAPSSEISSLKRKRGRPRGSRKKPSLSAITGLDFMPHVISVDVGEDIASKFAGLFKNGTRTICTISVSGSVSYASLQDPFGGVVNYEGPLNIISITGSILDSENTNGQAQTISLNVTLSTSDKKVVGGILGKLIAATPVQIIVGSVIVNGKKMRSVIPSVPQFHSSSSAAPPLPASKSSPSQDHSSGCTISNPIDRTVGYFNGSN